MKLTITNNYFADLAAAVEIKLFIRNGRNPNKEVLYAAIDAHNAQCIKTSAPKGTKSPSRKIADLIELLKIGATKEAICQTFHWKSWNAKTTVVLNYGYTLQLEDGIYSIAQ